MNIFYDIVIIYTNLVEEDIFSINTFSCKVFQYSFWTNSMFCTELLPELESDCIESATCENVRQCHTETKASWENRIAFNSFKKEMNLAWHLHLIGFLIAKGDVLIKMNSLSISDNSLILWFPHCPSCRVMTSLGIAFRFP